MDTVKFDGVEYKKASTIAKEFKYTSDYVGQLCRAKKVDARLVGRTWFVNSDSLRDHRQTKYQKNKPNSSEKKSVITKETLISRVNVPPVPRRSPLYAVSRNAFSSTDTRNIKVSYDLDEQSLIPHITKKHLKPSRTILIEHANAQEVKVKGKATIFNFTAEELPEVSLSGKLRVTAYPEATSNIEESKENKAISAAEKITSQIKGKEETATKVNIKHLHDQPDNLKTHSKHSKQQSSKLTPPTVTKNPNLSIVQDRDDAGAITLARKFTGFTPVTVKGSKKPMVKQSIFVTFSPLIATTAAIACVALIFSASALVLVSKTSYSSQITFQVANLMMVLEAK